MDRGGYRHTHGHDLLRRHHHAFESDRQHSVLIADGNGPHLALIGSKRLAGFERDHPVVQRAGHGFAVNDALGERAATLRANTQASP